MSKSSGLDLKPDVSAQLPFSWTCLKALVKLRFRVSSLPFSWMLTSLHNIHGTVWSSKCNHQCCSQVLALDAETREGGWIQEEEQGRTLSLSPLQSCMQGGAKTAVCETLVVCGEPHGLMVVSRAGGKFSDGRFFPSGSIALLKAEHLSEMYRFQQLFRNTSWLQNLSNLPGFLPDHPPRSLAACLGLKSS